MFDNFKIANYSNSLVSPELYARHFSRLITGNIIDGLTLVPKTGLTVTLQPGNALIAYGSGATASARMVSLVADFDITLSTADASNPRIDSIVCYVDTAVSLPGGTPTSANLDGPGVWKAVKVNGTPNASPVAPNSTAIQAAIGAGKPYFVAHDVRVDAGVTTIASNKITDRRVMAMPTLATSVAANIPDGTLSATKINYQSMKIGMLYHNTYGSAGGQVVVGTQTLAFNSFLTNSSTTIKKTADGVMQTTEAGFYLAVLNVLATDGGPANTTSSIQWSATTSFTATYYLANWAQDVSTSAGRSTHTRTGFGYLPANAYVRAQASVGAAIRFAGSDVDSKGTYSLSLIRLG